MPPPQPHKPYSTRRSAKHIRDLNGTWALSRTLSTGLPSALVLQGLNSVARKALVASPMRLHVTQNNYPSQVFVKQFFTPTMPIPEQTERFFPPQRLGRWSEWSSQRSGILGFTRSRCRWVRAGLRSEDEDSFGRGSAASSSDGNSTVGGSSTTTASDSNSHGGPGLDALAEEFLMEDVRKLGVGAYEFLEIEMQGLEEKAPWHARQVWVVDQGRLVRRIVTWGREQPPKQKYARYQQSEGGDVEAMPMKRAETRLVYEWVEG